MYMKTQELQWKENAIQNFRIEDSQGNVTVDHRQVWKFVRFILHNSMIDLFDQ